MSDEMKPLAIVIAPSSALAEMVCQTLEGLHYDVCATATHSDAAEKARMAKNLALAVVATRADGERSEGAYLREALIAHPQLAMVVMLSHPLATPPGIPETAVSVVIPFDAFELQRAVAAAKVRLTSYSRQPAIKR